MRGCEEPDLFTRQYSFMNNRCYWVKSPTLLFYLVMCGHDGTLIGLPEGCLETPRVFYLAEQGYDCVHAREQFGVAFDVSSHNSSNVISCRRRNPSWLLYNGLLYHLARLQFYCTGVNSLCLCLIDLLRHPTSHTACSRLSISTSFHPAAPSWMM